MFSTAVAQEEGSLSGERVVVHIMAVILACAACASDLRSRRIPNSLILLGALAGVAVYVAPFGSKAFAELFEEKVLTPINWNAKDGSVKWRIDGMSKELHRFPPDKSNQYNLTDHNRY